MPQSQADASSKHTRLVPCEGHCQAHGRHATPDTPCPVVQAATGSFSWAAGTPKSVRWRLVPREGHRQAGQPHSCRHGPRGQAALSRRGLVQHHHHLVHRLGVGDPQRAVGDVHLYGGVR